MIFFSRRGFEVKSLNVARTDINDLVMITIEAIIPEYQLQPFVERIKKIVEVFIVATIANERGLKKMGFYRLSNTVIGAEFWAVVQKYGATLCSIKEDSVVIQKVGYDSDLHKLYEHLEGVHLLSFCKSALIVEDSLKSFEELEQL